MIINNVSEIIEAIIIEERRKIKEFGLKIKHAPTIGKQFEGVTIKSLKEGLPKELNLHVTSGFIKNSKGDLSGQIDCMITKDNGILVPGTVDEYIYEFENVLAVIEVKKKLFSSELNDAYSHLKDVSSLKTSFNNLTKNETRILFQTFSKATGLMINKYQDIENVEDENLINIFHGLVGKFQHPLMIMIGFDGFKTEQTLRDKFYNFLLDKKMAKGFGPFSYPDMIISANSCLLKLNGEPYNPFMFNGYYEFFVSCNNYNIQILTELLFSRINRFYPFDFSGDDKIEPLKPFIHAKLHESKKGWDVLAHSINDFEVNSEWIPIEVSETAADVILQLLKSPELKLDENSINMQNSLVSKEILIEELLNTKYIAIKENIIFLISNHLKIFKTKDNKYLIGEDNFGYFTNWLIQNDMT